MTLNPRLYKLNPKPRHLPTIFQELNLSGLKELSSSARGLGKG